MNAKNVRMLLFFAILAALIVVFGCAKIPPASVELNQEVGVAIIKKHKAYVGLLDAFFDARAKQLDDFIFNILIPRYVDNLQKKLSKDKTNLNKCDSGCISYKFFPASLKELSKVRNKLIDDLNKTKRGILEKANEELRLVLSANAQLTALLQSAVDVQESQNRLAETVGKHIGYEVDLSALQSKFDGYLIKAGKTAKKGTDIIKTGESLYDTLKPVWGGNEERNE